jgi:MYXO-CTERM domain-containing protein
MNTKLRTAAILALFAFGTASGALAQERGTTTGQAPVVDEVETDDGGDWGWIGLLGLAGLAGLLGRKRHDTVHRDVSGTTRNHRP